MAGGTVGLNRSGYFLGKKYGPKKSGPVFSNMFCLAFIANLVGWYWMPYPLFPSRNRVATECTLFSLRQPRSAFPSSIVFPTQTANEPIFRHGIAMPGEKSGRQERNEAFQIKGASRSC